MLKAQHWPVIIGDNISTTNASLIEDYDKGYLLGNWNYKTPAYTNYGWIVKTNINGDLLWDKTFGDGEYSMYFSDVNRTVNNEIIISGAIGKYDNIYDQDPLFLKLNVCGEVEWCTVLHKEGSTGDDSGTRIVELPDGGYIGLIKYYGAQYQTIRISLVRMDAYGEPLWIQHLAQGDTTIFNEEAYDLIVTSDYNYLVAGRCYSSGGHPFFIMTNPQGNEIWDLKWNNQNVQGGNVDRVIEKNNGIFYASGGGKYGFYTHPVLFKFDGDGRELYYRLLLGDSLRGGGAVPLTMLSDTTFAIGYSWRTSSNPNDGNSEIATIDTLGNVIDHRWLQEENRPPSNIIKTFDGKIVVAGHYAPDGNIDIFLWKVNNRLEDDSLYTRAFVYDSLCSYPITSDTIDLSCGVHVDIDEIPTKEAYDHPLVVFPNPASHILNIETKPYVDQRVEIMSSSGITFQKVNLPDSGQLTLDISTWPHGLYLLCLFEEDRYVRSVKFLVN
ncbi:MAG: T9SS type A sorting domain-containing protein [Bacteroidales bacterium]|nr:T9SS type A sorting domain-containing protein [Bacteroidales bacterium]